VKTSAAFIVVVGLLCGAVAAEEKKPAVPEPEPKEQEVRVFTGEVLEIVISTQFSGKVIVAGNDPHWVVRVKVLKPESKGMEPAGSELVYLIHSPSRDLGLHADKAKGEIRRFREILCGGDFRYLEGRPLPAQEPAKDEKEKKK